MLLVPVICFCLPCVIRVLGMLQGPQRRKGARQDEIEKLPTGRTRMAYKTFDPCSLIAARGGRALLWYNMWCAELLLYVRLWLRSFDARTVQ